MNRSIVLLKHQVMAIDPLDHWEDTVLNEMSIPFSIKNAMNSCEDGKSITGKGQMDHYSPRPKAVNQFRMGGP